MLKSGSVVRPMLTLPRNIVDFTQPHELAATKGRIDDTQEEFEIAYENPRKAHETGVPMLTDTDSGFAVTPYGEWHARKPKFPLSVSASRRPRPCAPRPRPRWRTDARLAAE